MASFPMLSGTEFSPENQAPCDTTDASQSDQSRAAERPLPLASNVVTLISHSSWYIRIRSCAGQEDAEVSNTGVLSESHKRQTDDTEHHVEEDDWPTYVILVADPAADKHDDAREYVRWRDKALGCSYREAHLKVVISLAQGFKQRIRYNGGCLAPLHDVPTRKA